MSSPSPSKRERDLLLRSTRAVAALTLGLAGVRVAFEGPSAVALVLGLTSLSFAIQFLHLRLGGRMTDFSRWALPLTGLVGISAMSVAEGGLASEALFWLPSIPLVAVIFCGARGVSLMSALASIWVVVVLFLGELSAPRLFSAFGLLGAVGFGGVVGMAYERLRIREADELAHALRRAEAASRAKDHFLASTSHELRTPLNAILGFASLLRIGKTAPKSGGEGYAERIHRNGVHLLGLIDNILEMSRIEAESASLRPEPVALDQVVERVLERYAERIDEKGVDVTTSVPSPCVAMGTEAGFERVVAVLVDNAVKFTPEGGRVVVRVVTDSRGKPTKLEVVDTGPGIPREATERVFEMFTQVDQSTSREQGGLGAGLALAYRVSDSMGHELTVKSKKGKGSTFALRLRERQDA